MTDNKLFRVESINEHIHRIWDLAGTCMYLLEGSERSVLIDTGVGLGSLKAVIDELTDKPLSVIVTHGHVDHAMGAGEFDSVFMNLLDKDIYEQHSDNRMRLGYIQGMAEIFAGEEVKALICEENLIPAKDINDFKALNIGDIFDLGGITLEVLDCNGHTPGCVALLIQELRILILGDACNSFTFLFEDDCPSVETYMATLSLFKEAVSGKYDTVYFFHGPDFGDERIIDGVINICQGIMSGGSDAIPFESLGRKACIAKAMDFEHWCRVDGGIGNVVYNPNKIFNK